MHAIKLVTRSGAPPRFIECCRWVIHGMAAVTAVLSVLILLGCNDGRTTWSEEVRSPDGRWLATAKSQEWGGPGTAYDGTSVYLQWAKRPQTAVKVLSFSHNYLTMDLRLVWVNPNHLHVTYGPNPKAGDHVSVVFQAVKYGDVEISLEPASVEPANGTR
jgi:hypothetical protein